MVVQLDTAYSAGVSAIWFGVSVAALSVLVSLFLPLMRRIGYTSNSALLGNSFGPLVQRLTGLVIGLTFPIFAMSNALFAGVFLHVLLGWPLWLSLALTTLVLVVYIQFAGLTSLAATQGINLIFLMVAMALLAAILLGHPVAMPSSVPARFWSWHGIGNATILVWFGMNLLNVFSAQAEFQAVAAAQSLRHAQFAVWGSAVVLLGMVGLSTWIGIAVRQHLGAVSGGGLAALSLLALRYAHGWQSLLIALGVWALALTWCGPLLFSGAVSLGRDMAPNIRRQLGWTKIALLVEGALMVGYALWRPGEVAWWRVFGLTLRNAGVVGPTVALLLWGEAVSSGTVSLAIGVGIATGLGLNAITGFSPTNFIGGINPMWAAQAGSLLVLAGGRWRYARSLWAVGAWLLPTLGVLAWTVTGISGMIAPAYRGLAVLVVAGMAFAFTAWRTAHEGAPRESVKEDAGVKVAIRG